MKFTLTVDEKHLAVIEAGLNELPRKISQPLVDVLFAQVLGQRRAAAEKAEAARKKEEADREAPAATNGAAEPPTGEPAQA